MADLTPDQIKQAIEDASKAAASLKYEMFGAEDAARDFFKSVSGNAAQIKDSLTTFTKIKDIINDTTSLYARLGSSYISVNAVQKDMQKTQSVIDEQSEKINLLAKNHHITKMDEDKVLESLEKRNATSLNSHEQVMLVYLQQKKYLNSLYESQKAILGILPQQNDEYVKMGLKTSALAKAFSFISQIPILGQFMKFDVISDAFLTSFGTGMKAIGTQLMGLLKNPVIWLIAVIEGIKKLFNYTLDSIVEIDKRITSLSNNLGVSKKAGEALHQAFYDSSHIIMGDSDSLVNGLDVAFLSIRNMVAATTELQESLGTNVLFTDKMAQSQILLTKQMKLSSEEAAGIQKLSLITGKSADDILQTTIKQNTAGLSYRKIIKEVAGISAELSMRLGNDPEKIAAAVVQANKLGMSLEETRKISSSLLNFESSIEGELESELLLGKQFNFEKARELALMGKSSEAAGELLTQIGGITELEKMNVIQRERVAAAIGLSSDELSKSAIQQEVLNKLGAENQDALKEKIRNLQASNDLAGIAALQEEASKVQGGKVLLQDIAKATLAEKYEETMNRIKDILGSFVAHSTAIKILFVGLAALAAGFAASMMVAAIAALTISGGALAIGAGIGIGALTLAAGATSIYAVSDSVTAPGGNTISMPKGTLLPDKNDYVYTSTNPLLPTGGAGGNDNALISKIDELIYHTRKGKVIQYDTYTSTTAASIGGNQYA